MDAVFAAPGGLVLLAGLGLVVVDTDGTRRSRRISWDGFRDVHLAGERLTGGAWSPPPHARVPCAVGLHTLPGEGGSYAGPR